MQQIFQAAVGDPNLKSPFFSLNGNRLVHGLPFSHAAGMQFTSLSTAVISVISG